MFLNKFQKDILQFYSLSSCFLMRNRVKTMVEFVITISSVKLLQILCRFLTQKLRPLTWSFFTYSNNLCNRKRIRLNLMLEAWMEVWERETCLVHLAMLPVPQISADTQIRINIVTLTINQLIIKVMLSNYHFKTSITRSRRWCKKLGI